MSVMKRGSKFLSLSLAIAFALVLGLDANAATQWTRVSGPDRYKTSVQAAKYVDGSAVVFANGTKFQDALSAINICNSKNAKLVLVKGNENLSDYITSNQFKEVYIVGGVSSVSQALEDSVKLDGVDVIRLAGSNRYDTNLKTLEESGYKEVGVASGEIFADALSSSRFLKEKNAGLLLAGKNGTAKTDGYDVKYAFGGKSSVNVSADTVFAGKDRFDTSLKIAEASESSNIVFVNGYEFADALSAVNIANSKSADVVLISPKNLDRNHNLSLKAEEIFVVGGVDSVPQATVDNAVKGVTTSDNTSTDVVTPIDNTDSVVRAYKDFSVVKKANKYYLKNNSSGEIILKDASNKGAVKEGYTKFVINQDGSIKLGWFKDGGKYYYGTAQNGLARGFFREKGKIYYLDPDEYYMYAGGARSTGEGCYWFEYNGSIFNGYKPAGYDRHKVWWYMPSEAEMTNRWLYSGDLKAKFKGQDVANYAAARQGLPFKWFGYDLNNKSGVYCCGTTYSAFKENGIRIPGPQDVNIREEGGYRLVRAQYQMAPKFGGRYIKKDWNKYEPADILFTNKKKDGFNHVGLYMGKNGGRPMVVHATLKGGLNVEPHAVMYERPYYDRDYAVRYAR